MLTVETLLVLIVCILSMMAHALTNMSHVAPSAASPCHARHAGSGKPLRGMCAYAV